jgi:sugar-phosphatase
VVTSADFRLASVRLAAAGIAPTILVTSDDVSEGKPAPHGYVRAAQQLRVVPERCLVVEDSAAGLSAGRRAGAMTAALRNLDGDLVITNLGQLSDMLTLARETPCSTR